MKRASFVLRLAIVAGALLIPAAGFAVFHSVQIAGVYFTRKSARENPRLAVVPQPITIESLPRNAGVTLSYFGLQFETPWKEIEQIKQGTTFVRLQSKAGQFVMVWDPKQALNRVRTISDAAANRGENAIDVFGPEVLLSNYSLVRAELSMTPDQISISMPAKEAIRDMILLTFKSTETFNSETGLFSFQVGDLRGFQKGDPARAPVVVISAFDSGDQEYRLFVGVTKGKAAAVTQRDINAILSTLRPIEGPKQSER